MEFDGLFDRFAFWEQDQWPRDFVRATGSGSAAITVRPSVITVDITRPRCSRLWARAALSLLPCGLTHDNTDVGTFIEELHVLLGSKSGETEKRSRMS